MPYAAFVAGPRFVDPNGNPERTDPRVVADTIQLTWPVVQTEAAPVMPFNGGYLLLDGYLRSILIFRSENPLDVFLIWRPL